MSCGICNHRTHSACHRKHFTPYTSTCPGCPCHCLESHGFSYPVIAIPIPSKGRTALHGSLSPVNVSAIPVTRASNSLADHLRAYGGQPGPLRPPGRSAGSATSALGLDTSGTGTGTGGDGTPTPATTTSFPSLGRPDVPAGTPVPGGEARPGFLSKPLAGVWKGWSGDG